MGDAKMGAVISRHGLLMCLLQASYFSHRIPCEEAARGKSPIECSIGLHPRLACSRVQDSSPQEDAEAALQEEASLQEAVRQGRAGDRTTGPGVPSKQQNASQTG